MADSVFKMEKKLDELFCLLADETDRSTIESIVVDIVKTRKQIKEARLVVSQMIRGP